MSAVLGDSLARGLVKTRVREIDDHFENVKLRYLNSSSRNTNFRRGVANMRAGYRPVGERYFGAGKQKIWICVAFDIEPDGRIRLLKIVVPFKSPQDPKCLTFNLTMNPHCVQRLFQTLGAADLSVNTLGLQIIAHFGAMTEFVETQHVQVESIKTYRTDAEMVIWRPLGGDYEAITVIDCNKLDGIHLRDYQRLLEGHKVENALLIGGDYVCLL